jgi:hypothetical protein
LQIFAAVLCEQDAGWLRLVLRLQAFLCAACAVRLA